MSGDFQDVVHAARAISALPADSGLRSWAEMQLLRAAAALDVGAMTADALRDLGEIPSRWQALFGEFGAHGESLALSAAAEEGWCPVYQAGQPGANGLDLVLFHPDSEMIRVVEVKTTTGSQAFGTAKTKNGQQGDIDWVSSGLTNAGLEGLADYDRLEVVGAQIRIREGTITWLDRADDSGRKWTLKSSSQLDPGVQSEKPADRPKGPGSSPGGGASSSSREPSGVARLDTDRVKDRALRDKHERDATEVRRQADQARRDTQKAQAQAQRDATEERRQADQARRDDERLQRESARAVDPGAFESVVPGDRRIPAGDSRFAR
jgi:hypothetical protein